MGGAVQSAAYGEVVKAAGWTGLGCLQVALKKEKKIHYICMYVYIRIFTHYQFLGDLLSMN